MGSSPSKTKNGGGWKGTIYFDPCADQSSGDTYTMTRSELKRKFEELTETHEDILSVRIYKVPLSDVQQEDHGGRGKLPLLQALPDHTLPLDRQQL